MTRTAKFSPDRQYRYELSIIWDEKLTPVTFIGLNPSTADEVQDDPTIRRCCGFARDWGHGGIRMLNLFAFRATDPKDMFAADDPIGPENDQYLFAGQAGPVIAAWGVHGVYRGRGEKLRKGLPFLSCLGKTKDGHPRHPLYLKKTAKPEPFGQWPARPTTEGPDSK